MAVAESLTGGLLAAAITDVPGASDVLSGGVVAYSERAKTDVLGLDSDLLAAAGTVNAEVAQQMAARVSDLTGADVGVATTGVAGPTGHSGRDPGTVFVAWAISEALFVRELRVRGDREWVRQFSVAAALDGIRRLGSDLPLWEQDSGLWR